MAACADWLPDDAGFMAAPNGMVDGGKRVTKSKKPPESRRHEGFGERRYVALAYTRRSRRLLLGFTTFTVTLSAGMSTF